MKIPGLSKIWICCYYSWNMKRNSFYLLPIHNAFNKSAELACMQSWNKCAVQLLICCQCYVYLHIWLLHPLSGHSCGHQWYRVDSPTVIAHLPDIPHRQARLSGLVGHFQSTCLTYVTADDHFLKEDMVGNMENGEWQCHCETRVSSLNILEQHRANSRPLMEVVGATCMCKYM